MNIGEAMLFKNILRINDDANTRITYGVFKLIPKKFLHLFCNSQSWEVYQSDGICNLG